MMKASDTAPVRVPTADGHHILIDAADLPLVAGRRVYVVNGYASVRWKRPHNRTSLISLGRVILDRTDTEDGKRVRHRNGDPLDLRRGNLCLMTHAEVWRDWHENDTGRAA